MHLLTRLNTYDIRLGQNIGGKLLSSLHPASIQIPAPDSTKEKCADTSVYHQGKVQLHFIQVCQLS